jgi:osmotically-inducible protein OsmY
MAELALRSINDRISRLSIILFDLPRFAVWYKECGSCSRRRSRYLGKAMKSDMQLRQDVEYELDWDAGIDARNIAVTAKNGVVTLAGEVRNFNEKWHAEDIAKRIADVAGVASEIEIKLLDERTDTDIAEAATLAIQLDSRLPSDRIKVVVKHGWITLEGEAISTTRNRLLKVRFVTWRA